ncbi:protein Red [Nephila pilipes]|uniref:Protein Red n=1 Tax=Nephila pilipes TaxID=299642 RepID=A0A8X6UE70_NEPPI|nr:protein Red [Nephila pilipes]
MRIRKVYGHESPSDDEDVHVESQEETENPSESTKALVELLSTESVALDAKSGWYTAKRRREMIQESKLLDGDMGHTHLVKGLDYALLQKVCCEINYKEKEEEELENLPL